MFVLQRPPEMCISGQTWITETFTDLALYEETITALWDIYIIYSLGSTKNNDFCHNSDCLQVSVSLGVLPFTFESASEDLKCYASWFINKLCFRVILGSFCVAKKRYSSCTPLWCTLACHFHSSLCVCFWSFMEAGYLS